MLRTFLNYIRFSFCYVLSSLIYVYRRIFNGLDDYSTMTYPIFRAHSDYSSESNLTTNTIALTFFDRKTQNFSDLGEATVSWSHYGKFANSQFSRFNSQRLESESYYLMKVFPTTLYHYRNCTITLPLVCSDVYSAAFLLYSLGIFPSRRTYMSRAFSLYSIYFIKNIGYNEVKKQQ